MSKSTISTFQLFAMFPDQETARVYLEARLWPGGVTCPTCAIREGITTRKRAGFYRCNQCKTDFTVRTGTIFERSHVPLHKWVLAMYLLVTSRKGISSMQLAKEIGITQKSAWFVLHRLREACGNDLTILQGIVEVDEAYFGGKDKNRHASKRKSGRGTVGKTAVLGMREVGGRTRAVVLESTDIKTMHMTIAANIEQGSALHTDEHGSYQGLGLRYDHASVNHSAKEYVRGNVTTNGIESVWAVMKRGMHGVYHHASAKHLGRYVDEFTFRLNEGNVKIHTMDRLNSFIHQSSGRRLTYARLIA
jgi:transposase-like protein